MTYVFESRKPHLIFQVEKSEKNQMGHITKKGASVEFLGHFFATDDEDIAKSIKGSSMFSEVEGERDIWVRIQTEDKEVAQKVQKKKPAGRRAYRGAVGTSQER